MSDAVFCYHCRRQHPASESTQVLVHGRRRWRCLRSLLASQGPQQERDAWGAAVTALNRHLQAARQADRGRSGREERPCDAALLGSEAGQ